MTGPARTLVGLLRERPHTLAELAERTQYPTHRVLGFITEARSAGSPIHCRRVAGEEVSVYTLGG